MLVERTKVNKSLGINVCLSSQLALRLKTVAIILDLTIRLVLRSSSMGGNEFVALSLHFIFLYGEQVTAQLIYR